MCILKQKLRSQTLYRLLTVVIAAVAVQSAMAKTYVVSPQGDNGNPGTAEQPLLTISRGAELAMPGDTVSVKAGIYRERVAPPRGGEPGKPITYMAAPGERVIIKGSEVWQPKWVRETPGIYFAVPDSALFNDLRDEYVDNHNPLQVELASTPWEREGRREIERGYKGDERIVYTCGQVFVNSERWRQVPLKEELIPKRWYYEAKTQRVYVHFGELEPSNQKIELTTRRRIFAPTMRGLGYITVQGFVMEHCGNQYPTNFWETNANAQKGALGIEAGHHWIIRRNLIRHAKTFAIDAGYVDKRSRRMTPADNLIEENYLVDNGSAGILSNSSQNMVIRNNVILRNNCLRFFELKRWEQAGIKCHHFKDGLIEGNYVADNTLTYGVWLDNQFPDSRVTRNVLVNNERSGIFLEMSDYGFDRLLVDNNVIVGNGECPVYIHDASGATFVNNLMADSQPDNEFGQAVFIRQVSARTKTYHHTFYNNLMLSNSVTLDVNYPAHRSGPQRFDGNVYGCGPEDAAFRINKKSDKPSPWEDNEFLKLVQTDVGGSNVPNRVVGRGHTKLNFDQWRRFWKSHDLANDQHSVLSPESTASYDPESNTVTVDLRIDPSETACRRIDRIKADFLGKAMPSSQPLAPGPFQSLQKGVNTFQVWDGLPILAAGKLPPEDWNRIETQAVKTVTTSARTVASPN